MWGASQQVVDEWRKALHDAKKAETLLVWPEHWHALRVFLAMGRQWHVVAGPGGVLWQGLRMEALPAVAAGVKPGVPPALRQPYGTWFQQLLVMQDAAAEALADRAA